MRISLLLAAAAFVAFSNWAAAQTPPAENPVLSPAVKPKPAPVQPEAQPETDPNDLPTVIKPEVKPQEPTNSRDPKRSDPTGTKDTTDALNPDATANSTGPDYTGPSILSRGMNFTRPSLPSNERFRPFAGVNFYHDAGVTGKYQGPLVPVVDQSYTGLDFNFGVSGQHTRRLDTFELDYRGHVYVNSYTGQDHALTLGYSRILSKRLTISLSEGAGLYSNNYSVLNSVSATDTSVANTALVVTPNTEAFDNRTYYSSTQADLTYQKSARLSFNIGASGFYVKRSGSDLVSANGYQTRMDVAYRVQKRSTLGPYYAYSRYLYSGTFGDSDVHTIGINYSIALGKRTQFGFRVGGSRLETRGLQLVVLSPEISNILGIATGIQRYYAVSYTPDFAVDLSHTVRHGNISASYTKGVSPGNGLVLTSRHDSVSVNYTYSGIRRYGITVGAGRDSLGSVAQQIGTYSSYFGRLSISRPLSHDLQAIFNLDYRKLGFTDNVYARDQFRISIGLAFTPGYGPLKFW